VLHNPPVGRLDGKVAIVTGAGGEIGRAMVIRLAEQGAQVVAADIDEARVGETAELAREHGDVAHRRVDVSQADQVEELVKTAVGRYGRLTTMCNNASTSIGGDVTDVSVEDFDRTIAVDLRAVFLGCKYAVPAMLEAGGGSIVNVGSVTGLVPQPALAADVASEGGVVMLSKAIALDFGAKNIRCNCLCLGMANDRQGYSEAIASAAVYLASDESAFVTGSALVIDGARTAR
jgi:meso-butanediol dehydrogenase/(S,S)-butanediol dehydrogenase/diacetyl reductase